MGAGYHTQLISASSPHTWLLAPVKKTSGEGTSSNTAEWH